MCYTDSIKGAHAPGCMFSSLEENNGLCMASKKEKGSIHMKKKNVTKHALLASVLAMVLCVTMLVGTTFAWFTDTASANVNKIQSGKLDVDIVDTTTAHNSLTKDNQVLSWQKAEGHEGEAVLWEPGCTYNLTSFQIANKGNLNLKYKVVISGAKGDLELLNAIDFTYKIGNGESQSAANGATIINDARLDAAEEGKATYSAVITITGTMKTTAGNEYQNKTLEGIAITVYATQETGEYDSTTNEYDKDATYSEKVSTKEELTAAIEKGSSVVLEDNMELTDVLTVAEGKTVKIDLNGKTLTDTTENGMEVNGTLVIEDESGSGSVVLNGSNASINVTENATLVVNSGKIETFKEGNPGTDYAIYCRDGGKAIINGGEITSTDAPLTGNNTTGNMNFVVTGGTITAKRGPAIYMSGQSELTITGGTLNGGISLRMGQVNISGGTINAVTDNIDDPKDYYDYSGNVWLPDALYVLGGTYTSGDATYGNSLNLNITGGTFNCTNSQGSAVAIYDLGKVEQTMNVTIFGASLSTNATGRQAAQVLSFDDIGVTSPKAGYGVYSGNVNFSVK